MTGIAATPPSLTKSHTRPVCAALALPTGVVALIGLVIGFQPLPRDPDLWFHLASGEYIVQYAAVPDTDPFSFTRAGETWVPHSWLFDAAVALSWDHLGPRATEAIFALIFAAVVLIAFGLLLARRVPPLAATAVCLGLALAAANTRGIRPQVISLLLCTIVIALLVRNLRRPDLKTLVALPLIFLLWAQVHAGCVIGLVVIAVWLIGRAIDVLAGGNWPRQRREIVGLTTALGCSTLAVLITPHRMTHFAYVAMTSSLETLRHTQEWQPPQALSLAVPDVYAFVLLAAIVGVLARAGRRATWADIALCVPTLVLALSAVRHIPLACVATVPLMGSALGGGGQFADVVQTLRRHVTAYALAALVIFALIWKYPTSALERYAAVEPVAGARALAQLNGTWRVFTTYNTGSYVLHEAPGRLRVFIDSRADVFGDELFAAMRNAQLGRGWQELLERWDINAAVVERDDPLANILREDPDWRLLAEDPMTVTFIRADFLPQICERAIDPSRDCKGAGQTRTLPQANSGSRV